jgi:glucokinase
MSYYIAVDIGGTHMRAACYPKGDLDPDQFVSQETHQNNQLPQSILKSVIQEVWPKDAPVNAIGIASVGPLDLTTGSVITAPNIPEWLNFPIVDFLSDQFRVPVFLDNDANLAALGEWKYGSGVGHHNLVYVTVSTGIGGGVIIEDRILHGERGLAAELGHITVLPDGPLCTCGQYGHLEAVASGPAIAKSVKEAIQRGQRSILSADQIITSKMVANAATAGDELALTVLNEAAEYLGRACADFLHIFNPSILIIGGGVAQSGEILLDPLRQAVKRYTLSPEYMKNLTICPAALGSETGLIGALALAENSQAE